MIMKKLLILFLFTIMFTGCSDTPSSSEKTVQYDLVKENVKKILGSEYEAVNFNVIEEGYTDEAKTKYLIKFTFDLNKSYLVFDGKKIPAELIFNKENGEWKCTFNSGNATGLFNLLGN